MRRFRCDCGRPLFFDNTSCSRCGRRVGFAPDRGEMLAAAAAEGVEPDFQNGYRACANGRDYSVCNWLVPGARSGELCTACELTRTIPNLERPENLERWRRLESAKRRLLYTLLELRLPLVSRRVDAQLGLVFDFLEDRRSNPAVAAGHVATGHADGVITLNVAEADPVAQARVRERMNEQYRTVLGHMRHESGHYYWGRLVRGGRALADFRRVFGDERADYAAALKRHYAQGPPPDWRKGYVSAYASAHPWEDWAESWAHYLHMTDTLETAGDFGLLDDSSVDAADFDSRMTAWLELSVLLNELNRSMGQDEPYPFVLPPPVVDKLRFVDRLTLAAGV